MSHAQLLNVVAGRPVQGRRTFLDVNPVDGSVAAEVHEAGPEVVDAAVATARRALDHGWSGAPVAERVAAMRRIADGIEDRFEDFVAAEVADNGKPEHLVRELDVARAAMNFRSFADTVASTGLDS